MYRVCIYDSKAAEDTLFIKEIIIDERGEVQEISESQNFSDYYARISEQEKERPDILVTELNHNAQELQLIEQMWKMNPDLQTVYVMDKSHVLTKPVSQSSVVECVNRRMIEDSHMISFPSIAYYNCFFTPFVPVYSFLANLTIIPSRSALCSFHMTLLSKYNGNFNFFFYTAQIKIPSICSTDIKLIKCTLRQCIHCCAILVPD